MNPSAVVLNVQRFTLHDGPGIRTELFLKGCPLRCAWCGNPESFNRQLEVGVYANKCLGDAVCGDCTEACQQPHALQFQNGKIAAIDRQQCSDHKDCLACAQECPAEALKVWGKSMTVDECMQIILKDKGYYQRSGGGVTVSGGEPLMQSEFVFELFRACQKQGIHTCLESSFYSNWDRIERLLPKIDLFISDIKLLDTHRHKQFTGVDNQRILENLIKLTQADKPLIVRIPVIPTINDDDENIQATADFIEHQLQGRVLSLQLLSFMRLGEEKYQSLGLEYPMRELDFDRLAFQQRVNKIAEYFRQRGIKCTVGTSE